MEAIGIIMDTLDRLISPYLFFIPPAISDGTTMGGCGWIPQRTIAPRFADPSIGCQPFSMPRGGGERHPNPGGRS
jgi:hypothetical protein